MTPIIFDFNGTMFLDTDKNIAAWTKLIGRETGYTLTKEDFKQQINGVPNVEIVRHFIDRDLSLAQARVYSEAKEDIYRELCLQDRENFHLTPGLPDFLEHLREQKVPINIATGADKSNIDFYLQYLNLGRWFVPEKIIYSDGSFPGKPHPDIYLLAAAALDVDIQDCWVFEDAYLGVKAAAAAGVKRILGLAAIPESAYLDKMPEVSQVIRDFTSWREWQF